MPRTPLPAVLMDSARLWAQRSTCSRLQVGCVIASPSGRILASGYNGAPTGLPHCTHPPESGVPCHRAIHAESNAILWAGRNATPVVGATLYTTHSPCLDCAKQIVTSGIAHVVYALPYRSPSGLDFLRSCGILPERI